MKRKSISQSAFFNLRIVMVAAVCVLGVALTLFGSGALSGPNTKAQAGAGGGTNGGSHKLSVRDRQLAASLKDRGAHVVSDYGSSVLLEANDSLVQSVAGNTKAQLVDYNNLLL